MRDLSGYAMLSRLPWLGYRGKILLLASLGAIAAAIPGAILFFGGGSMAASASAIAATLAIVAALVAIAELLRPIGVAAATLADPTDFSRAAKLRKRESRVIAERL